MAVFGDMIPFIDGVIRFGTGSVAMEIGLLLSLVTIARDDSKETGETPRSIPPPEPPHFGPLPSGRGRPLGPAATGDSLGEGRDRSLLPAGEKVPEGRIRGTLRLGVGLVHRSARWVFGEESPGMASIGYEPDEPASGLRPRIIHSLACASGSCAQPKRQAS